MIVAVIGGGTCGEADAATAYATGAELARRGHVLVCGGMGGVMREACRGAKEHGGRTIGILPGDDRAGANEYIDIPIVTGLGHARNVIVVRTADAVIAVGGRAGTLSEIAFAVILSKPVAGLGTWRLEPPSGEPVPLVACATAIEAVDFCERSAGIPAVTA